MLRFELFSGNNPTGDNTFFWHCGMSKTLRALAARRVLFYWANSVANNKRL